jgi:magnesium chelatase family protein
MVEPPGSDRQPLQGDSIVAPPEPRGSHCRARAGLDLAEVKRQESSKRALEIAAAGGHNMFMVD